MFEHNGICILLVPNISFLTSVRQPVSVFKVSIFQGLKAHLLYRCDRLIISFVCCSIFGIWSPRHYKPHQSLFRISSRNRHKGCKCILLSCGRYGISFQFEFQFQFTFSAKNKIGKIFLAMNCFMRCVWLDSVCLNNGFSTLIPKVTNEQCYEYFSKTSFTLRFINIIIKKFDYGYLQLELSLWWGRPAGQIRRSPP